MMPLLPAYSADASLDDHSLGLVRFGESTSLRDGVLTLALPPRGPNSCELWRSTMAVTRGERDGVAFAHNDEVLLGAAISTNVDVAGAALSTYDAIVRVTRAEGFPFLLRAWNHVRDINRGEGDAERYRHFCSGRHDALTAAGFRKSDFPSASAVGMLDGGLAVYFIASRQRGMQLENPRQVSAYDYPREYGPRSPSFARATVAPFGGSSIVFVSGTSSVVGHETRHAGDVALQVAETSRNLHGIIEKSGTSAANVCVMKVYVRRAADTGAVVQPIATSFPSASLLVLESDICRRDLLLEVEAIAIKAG